MSDEAARPPGDSDPGRRGSHPGGRVVISSVTGRPMIWRGTAPSGGRSGDGTPLLPDRTRDEQPEPGADESNDARLARDVPPHWGTGT